MISHIDLFTGFTYDYSLTLWLQIKSSFTKPPDIWNKGSKGDIILIPGLGATWIFFEYLANNLNQLGYRIHVNPEFDRTTMSRDEYVKKLRYYLEKRKLKKVIFLCHSRGGSISKYFTIKFPEFKPFKAIHIASGYKDAIWSRLHIFSLDEFDSHSKINQLISSDKNNHFILNLYPKYDTVHFSSRYTKLENAENRKIDVIGHAVILFSKNTLSEITSFLNSFVGNKS